MLDFQLFWGDDNDSPVDELPYPDWIPPVQYHQDVLQQTPSPLNISITLDEEEEEIMEENFQTVPLEDEHWNLEEIPDRLLCIHEHPLLHGLYPF